MPVRSAPPVSALSKLSLGPYTDPKHIERTIPEVSDTREKSIRLDSTSSTTVSDKLSSTKSSTIPDIVEILLRTYFRLFERKFFHNPVSGNLFRFASELIRHGTKNSLKRTLEGSQITKKVLIESARSAAENTFGRFVFNTNAIATDGNAFVIGAKRAFFGFGNMVIRLAFRLGLVTLNLMEPKEIESETLADEFAGRTFARISDSYTDNMLIDGTTQTVQQGVINIVMKKLPIKSFIENTLTR